MSPATRSKSKDKRAAGKEPQKSSAKPTTNTNTGGGVPASGYNPLLGTFHTLETAPASSASPIHANGRFRNIDETDDPSGNSVGMGAEYDSVSNNGSCSSESEDQKEKTSQGPSRQDTLGVDGDKREKNRQKNEKKHQRQKERRAQELHERCSGYLMSRKLEALAQQLVAMGFPSERATMALILNEGRIEESVAWLFEGGEDTDNKREHNLDSGGNLKVDISEELAQIADMETKFKCSKQEAERVVVVCEGDLQQAAETLMKVQKQESPAVPPKPDETGDPPTVGGSGKPSVAISQNSSTLRLLSKRTPTGAMSMQQKIDDKDFNYTKMAVAAGRTSVEPGSKNIQLLKKIQPNSEWAKQQQVVAAPSAEKRWPVGGLSNPSVSFSLASSLQSAPPPSKVETQYAIVGNELKNLQLGSMREPVIVIRRPQSKHTPTVGISSSSSSLSHVADWNCNGGVEPVLKMNPNRYTKSFSTPSYGSNISNQLYNQFHYQQPLPHHHQLQHQQHYISSTGLLDPHGSQPGASNHLNNNSMWNRMVGGTTTPTLAAASSLGLFSGSGSNGGVSGPSHADWNANGVSQFDYTNIDWSLHRLPPPARPNGMLMSLGPSSSSGADLYGSGRSNGKSGMAGIVSNRVHPDSVVAPETSGAGSREWSSPFEEKDLFSLPRQFVSSQ